MVLEMEKADFAAGLLEHHYDIADRTSTGSLAGRPVRLRPAQDRQLGIGRRLGLAVCLLDQRVVDGGLGVHVHHVAHGAVAARADGSG